MWTLITLTVGVLGALVFKLLNLGGGMLVGAIFSTLALNLITGKAYIPVVFSTIVKIGTGAYIGSKINKKNLKELLVIIGPIILMIFSFIAYNILAAWILSSFVEDLSFGTAMFAIAPGGIAEMSLIGEELGCNSAVISASQTCRQLMIIVVSPFILKALLRRMNLSSEGQVTMPEDTSESSNTKSKPKDVIITIAVATVFGILGSLSGIPAGAILFSVVATAVYSVLTGKGSFPVKLRQLLKICSGALVGSRITAEDLKTVWGMLVPILLVMIGYIAMNIGIGLLIHKKTDMSLQSALFGTSAAGMAEMTLLAGEMGGNTAQVATMQVVRNITVIAIYPIIIEWLMGIFG